MKLHLHNRILIFLFLLLPSCFSFLAAQPPEIICPGSNLFFSDLSLNNQAYWAGGGWFDSIVGNPDLAEHPTVLEITTLDHCSSTSNLTFRYILSFDLNRDSTFETFVDSDSLPGRDTIYYGNSLANLTSGVARRLDLQPHPASEKFGFGLSVTAPVPGTMKAKLVWQNNLGNTKTPEIPYGKHKIKWIVTDSCGLSSTCEYNFTIYDYEQPTITCNNGLSVNILNYNGGQTPLWATDFLDYVNDNYTPSDKIQLGIRRGGAGTGFPTLQNGNPQFGIEFNCNFLGTQPIELWAKDTYGNTNHCNTSILIQDNLGICSPLTNHSGRITTADSVGISDVSFEITGNTPGLPSVFLSAITDSMGYFKIDNSLPFSSNATLSPILDLDPLNGVNTFDLILISRHILGLEPLNTPYKLISADANKSGTLTTFDVVELRKLILGTYTKLPNNKSWRFVDKQQTFWNPMNPFAEVIKENIKISEALANNLAFDFIGCKIGDVDETAIPNFQGGTEDRNYDLKVLTLQNRRVQSGETFTVHIATPEDASGLQMTFATKGLQLDKIIPSNNCSKDNFGLFSSIGNMKALPAFTAAFENGAAGFDAVFKAIADGDLKDMLEINSDITRAMAFDAAGRRYDVALRFEDENETSDQPVFFQNNPNPWSNETRLAFYLPEAGTATITVTGQNGQSVIQQNGNYAAGYHQVRFEKSQFAASGIYYVRMQTGSFSEVRKMMFYKNN